MGMMDGRPLRRAIVAASGLVGTVGLLGLLLRCSTDPRGDQSVTVITACDETKLNASASSPESTVKAYVHVSASLVQKTQDLQVLMKDGCNAVNAELALPAGADMASACLTLYNRINAVVQAQPPPPPGPPPAKWFNLALPSSCRVDPNVRHDL